MWLDSPVFPSSLLCCKNDKLNSAIMFKVLKVKPSASILKCKDFVPTGGTVPLKVNWQSWLNRQDSILASWSLNALSFVTRESSLNFQASSFEKKGFYVELILFSCCTVPQPFRNSHGWSVLAVRCSLTVWIASFGKLLISINQYFGLRRFILHIQCITLGSWGSRLEWLLTCFWAVLYLHMRIKPQGSSPCRCPNPSSFWKRIYCMQFLSYNILYILE